MKTVRSNWIDLIKAISIILVVYGHVARGVHTAGLAIDEQGFRIADNLIYSFHMPLFFFVSGLLLTTSLQRRGAQEFLKNKARLLIYPYVIWSLIQGMVGVLLSHYTNSRVSIAEVLSFPWHPRDQFWFLYALFLVFLAVTPCYLLLGERRKPLLLALATAGFLIHQQVSFSLVDTFILSFSVYVVLGMCFSQALPFFQRHAGALTLLLGAAFLAAQYVFHAGFGLTYENAGAWTLPLASISIFFVTALCIWLGRMKLQWLCYIGMMSMPVFLMHILAGSGVRIVLRKFLGVESAPVHVIAGTVAGVLLPLLAYRILLRCGGSFLFIMPARGERVQRRMAGERR